ncbi:MAG: helix-turn-helix transcriptional regulator [Phycisphaerae bacterium]
MSAEHRKPPLMKPEEVARRLGISRATFYRWAALGEGPPAIQLPSGHKRWDEQDVESWIRRHRQRAG